MICWFLAAEKYERTRVPNSMMHLLRDSKKNQHKKKWLEMVQKRNAAIGEHNLSYVSEYFHYVHEWPAYAIEIILSDNFGCCKMRVPAIATASMITWFNNHITRL